MSKYVKIQKTRVIKTSKDASNSEQSQYWDDFNSRGRNTKGDEAQEHTQANPDSLPETQSAWISTPQLIMGEAIDHLQGRQKEVYMLTMRDNKSLAEAAEILGIEKGSAQKYKERAIRFIQHWCKQAIAKGRV
jgi:DNA-directed RNA polymerase specialized sigma24 family protein